MNKANECTCPSGDGSLVHPCPAHPADQAGGDERVIGWRERILAAHPNSDPGFWPDALLVEHMAAEIADLRAALAQPSPVPELERPATFSVPSCENSYGFGYVDGTCIQSLRGYRDHLETIVDALPEGELMTVAQHDRIVGELRAENAKLSEALDRWPLIRDSLKLRLADALARVAELEKELAMARDAASKGDAARHAAGGMEMEIQELREKVTELQKKLRSRWTYASTQATNCAGCGEHKHTPLRVDWMGGYVCLTCIDKKLEELHDDQAQHSVPEGWKLVPIEPLLNMMSDKDHDTRITAERQLLSILAAAPGNSVPQAWLDVQAERRRQITAEGWTPEHDDEHADGQMAQAAGCYALHAGGIGTDWPDGRQNGAALFWPWDKDSWKPTTPRRDLVKACALALAEIERLDRAGISQSPQPGATTASS
ncbi:hypothetical protein [Pseudomonas aeruginosa]|uniref:hypothetical protein n=1 Tax=Pseudomonas aeruginosa TaxID=287 RepID=UPI00295578BA|nr:hypothetical protein [Pseudomonas aeruginosa]MDV8062351.1 hypothetical protein [Pseudomonas aeruginosa]MDV8089959.1 hypothetical protein [Pseudomonas aeruginosa]